MLLEASNVRTCHAGAVFPFHLGKVRLLSVGGLLLPVPFVFVSVWTFVSCLACVQVARENRRHKGHRVSDGPVRFAD
jgi:hypothetical protein